MIGVFCQINSNPNGMLGGYSICSILYIILVFGVCIVLRWIRSPYVRFRIFPKLGVCLSQLEFFPENEVIYRNRVQYVQCPNRWTINCQNKKCWAFQIINGNYCCAKRNIYSEPISNENSGKKPIKEVKWFVWWWFLVKMD